jgi:cytochrome oxidase Cu insertion factor (SCO1/SenC/PrrC family)
MRTAPRATRSTWRWLWCAAAVGIFAAANAAGAPAVAARIDQLPQQWRDDGGGVATFADWAGQRIVLTMAYVDCRRICPATMGTLKRLQRELDARGESAEFVVVGYDPQTDGPAAWHRYRARHGLLRANWHFLSGSRGDTEQFARQLGFGFWKYDDHVVHDARIVVFDAHGVLHAEADPGTTDLLAVL